MGRIICAEDDMFVRSLLEDVLSDAVELNEHSVTVYRDGQEALDAIRSNPADVLLVVTDVSMPVLDGLGLVQAARALGINKFIVQSDEVGKAKLWAQFQSAAAGGEIIPLPKPWEPSQLRQTIQVLLEG